MEKLVSVQIDEAEQWPAAFIREEKPWFRLATLLGEGENCAVFSLGHTGKELVYTESEGDSESMSCDDSHDDHTCNSSCEDVTQCGSDGGVSVSSEDGSEAECKFDATLNGVDIDTAREVCIDDIRVHADTVAGKVQVVAKVFKHLDDDVGYGLYDSSDNIFLKWFVDEEEATDYMRRRHFTLPRFKVQEVKFHSDSNTVRFCDFQHESLTNLFLSKFVDCGLTPHITVATGAVAYKNTGYLLLERVDCTMDDLLADEHYELKTCGRLVDAPEIASLFFQAVFGLFVLQHTCQLKHHDLHTGNLFLQRITADSKFRGELLHDATHFHYKLNDFNFYLPNCGAMAKLGDFAMASFKMHGKRMQRVDMDAFNDNVEKWGYWNAQYQEERGYDTQFLFADVPVDGRHRKNHALYKFLKTIRAACMGKRGRVTPKKFRPMPGYISNQPADAVLTTVFTKKVLPDFNFLIAPPEGSRVVTLGSSDWLKDF